MGEPQKQGLSISPLLSPPEQISLDDNELAQHPATTEDIRVCCQDIKVLGRKELRFALGVGRSSGSPEGGGEAWEVYDARSRGTGCCCVGGPGWGPESSDLRGSHLRFGVWS